MLKENALGFLTILRFWLPLAATWLMMSAEGPFIAAIVSRLGQAQQNLAAFGVAFAIAIIVEAPIIMIMSASTALVKDRIGFVRLRSFTYGLSLLITSIQALLVFSPAWSHIARQWIQLDPQVSSLTQTALIILLPWPGMIGYRRFYQGLLIRSGQTRLVAYGTILRLASMATTGLVCYFGTHLPGAYVGAAALAMGVSCEGICARVMARRIVRELLQTPADANTLGYREIIRFYTPLALTSTISLAVQPLVTFFVGHSQHALESLAVLPVVNGLVFIFRSLGLAYQEVVIALAGKKGEHLAELCRFALVLATCVSCILALLAFTPLANIWFESISGLTSDLAVFAYIPTQILAVMPALSVLLSLQRGLLVYHQKPIALSVASALEVTGILIVLMLTIDYMGLVGASAAAISLVVGRLMGNAFLAGPVIRVFSGSGAGRIDLVQGGQ